MTQDIIDSNTGEVTSVGYTEAAKGLRRYRGLFGYVLEMLDAMAIRCEQLAEGNRVEEIEAKAESEYNGTSGPETAHENRPLPARARSYARREWERG